MDSLMKFGIDSSFKLPLFQLILSRKKNFVKKEKYSFKCGSKTLGTQ